MSFVDEIFEEGTPLLEEDMSPFAGAEDENAESHMDEEEVK
jgi:hypothetical protein